MAIVTIVDTDDPCLRLLGSATERSRYDNVLQTLNSLKTLFEGRRALDFGASWGTSVIALLRQGAGEVVGVEPDKARVERGGDLLVQAGFADHGRLIHVEDTSRLPFRDQEFEFVLANAVLEHIPQPRAAYIRELWRVLASDGHLVVSETPNKYFPKEIHTTSLWFNHWFPREWARRRAVRKGRFDPQRNDWNRSGWRGLGYFELTRPLGDYGLVPERNRLRHRLLSAAGLPASIFDPYPVWVLRKG